MKYALAIYPTNRGLGLACIKMPQTLLEAKAIYLSRKTDPQIINRIFEMLDFYRPDVILLRDQGVVRDVQHRCQTLLKGITKVAEVKKLPVYSYSRLDIQEVFELYGATNKFQISQLLIKYFPELSTLAPKARDKYHDESYTMATFDAIALAVVHSHMTN